MNYIKEINAFYIITQTNPLSPSASASASLLWHTLMHINNQTRWKPSFTVAVSILKTKTGVSESTIKRARDELQTKGFIHYHSRGGNQAAEYQMVSLWSI
ncbi:helix-turn-helix domain-containing protein [Salinibacillus xinjiangensis]|uniref:Helix-turn-helix domain-containing protein n=1 Tax=Salinibacillus xinjiangensis TaxID=1229268 RepID=A0A6G1X9I9_9BACI|nr:helix-turn-helix domain-containing protein [Salinibacillus xinjiangensis]MRG87644.1 hypothetical protein [Salinibacillus xinjiangensis]